MWTNEAITCVHNEEFTMTESYSKINYNAVKWQCIAMYVNSNAQNVKEQSNSTANGCLVKQEKNKVHKHYANALEIGPIHWISQKQPKYLLCLSSYLFQFTYRSPNSSSFILYLTVSVGTLHNSFAHHVFRRWFCKASLNVSPMPRDPGEQYFLPQLVTTLRKCSVLILVWENGHCHVVAVKTNCLTWDMLFFL